MEQSEKRAAAEIEYASLVVNVAGRDALPVRAIPYVSGWSISPDVVAKQLARAAADGFQKLQHTDAYHRPGGRVVKLLPKEWDAYVAALDGFEAELKGKFVSDDEGYAAWVSRSVAKLPAGVFVWLDEFTADWQRDFGPERLSIMGERPGDRELNLSPYLANETLNMVLDGFGPREPLPTHEGEDFVADLAERVLNGRPIDWDYWAKNMPTLTAAEAARLMAGLDPELFEDLASRPVPKNDPSRACAEAKRMERLAQAQGRCRHTPEEWLRWAHQCDFDVHRGFFMAVRGRQLRENAAQVLAEMPRAEAMVWEGAAEVGEGRRQVSSEYANHVTTVAVSFPEFIAEVEERLARWRRGRYELIEAAQVLARANGLDAGQLAAQMDEAIHAGRLTYRLNNIPVDADRIPRQHVWHRTVLLKDVNAWLSASEAGYQLEYPYDAEDQGFVPLEKRLAPYFGLPLAQLPADIATLVREEINWAGDGFVWDTLAPDQRRSLAQQRDARLDPAREAERAFYWNQVVREEALRRRLEEVERTATPTATDLHLKREMLAELQAELEEVHRQTLAGPTALSGEPAGDAQGAFLPKQRLQEQRILAHIRELGFEPTDLPERQQGRSGVKRQVRELALKDLQVFQSDGVFDRAWERLRSGGEIKGG